MRIRKGDNVLIAKGKDRGRKGKVLRDFIKEGRVLVEGINIKKVHKRPRKEGEKGQVVEVPFAVPFSNLKLICPKCAKPTKVGVKKEARKKLRICKKCQAEI